LAIVHYGILVMVHNESHNSICATIIKFERGISGVSDHLLCRARTWSQGNSIAATIKTPRVGKCNMTLWRLRGKADHDESPKTWIAALYPAWRGESSRLSPFPYGVGVRGCSFRVDHQMNFQIRLVEAADSRGHRSYTVQYATPSPQLHISSSFIFLI
jgi:hypothetical protein